MKKKSILLALGISFCIFIITLAQASQIISPSLVANEKYLIEDFENLSSGSNWGEESGNWAIISTTDENNESTQAYWLENTTEEYKYNFNKEKSFADASFIFKFKKINESSRVRFHFRVRDSSHFYTLQHHKTTWYLMEDRDNFQEFPTLQTCQHNQINGTWYWAKIISNKEQMEVYYSDDGESWTSCLSHNDSSYSSGYIGIGGYERLHYFDNIIVQENQPLEDSTDDFLTLSYFFNGKTSDFINETIEFYNSGILNYTIFNTDSKSENKSLPSSYTSTGETWNAKLIVCSISGCEEALTQNVSISNSAPYFIQDPSINDDEPRISETINCTSLAKDADNDAIRYYYKWYNNSKLLSNQDENALILTRDLFRKNDIIICSMQVCDSNKCSIWKNSSSVKIINYASKIDRLVEILPKIEYKEKVHFSVVVNDTDLDSLEIKISLNNSNNESIFNNTKLTKISASEDNVTTTWISESFLLNELGIWRFTITAYDGEETRTSEGYFTVAKKNYAPKIISAAILRNKNYFSENFENSESKNWNEEGGNWSLFSSEEKGYSYKFSGNSGEGFQYNSIKDANLTESSNFTLIFSANNLKKGNSGLYISFCGFCDSMRPRIIFKENELYCLEAHSSQMLNSTLSFNDNIENGFWRENYKAVKNGNNFKVYLGNSSLACDINFSKLEFKGIYLGGYEDSQGYYDDIIYYENVKEAEDEDNLTLVYHYYDQDSNVSVNKTISWYKNGEFQENLTSETLISDYTSPGDSFYAIITICDEENLCSSEKTQEIKIKEYSNLIQKVDYKNVKTKISSITGFAVSAVGDAVEKEQIYLLPLFLIMLFILQFIINEIRIAKAKKRKREVIVIEDA